jgi:ABC-type Fe3+/spermidine/putrescine transport system ATPase subunit
VDELAAEASLAPGVGSEVWVSVRPECLALTGEAASAVNAVEVTVESTTYLGELAEHRVRAGTELLRVYELNPGGRSWPSGKRAVVTVAPADVVLLAPEADDA